MGKLILTLFVTMVSLIHVDSQQKIHAYLIPGHGSDERVYKNLILPERYEIHHIKYTVPDKDDTMQSYAKKLAEQIDTTTEFIIIGFSLGGMLATELTELLNPQKTIIISSAKCRQELPGRYRMLKYFPMHHAFPPDVIKQGAKAAQPIVEPDRKKEKETFQAMLNDKDKIFMKRAINLIVSWDRETYNSKIVHIHGNNDHTLPDKNVNYDYLIDDGSHMMVLTRGEEISKILKLIL
jgi:esterase/lipase